MGLEVHVHVWTTCFNDYIKVYLHVLMMRRKEERSKQGKQTRQSNTAHPRQSLPKKNELPRVHASKCF